MLRFGCGSALIAGVCVLILTTLVLGTVLALAGLYALLSAAGPTPWTTTAFAALIFVSPWAFGFTGSHAAAWTAWIAGGIATIVGVWDATQVRSASTVT